MGNPYEPLPPPQSGLVRYADLLERKRQLLLKVHTIAGTEYLDLLENFVQVLYQQVRPYHDR